jgi:predicted flap endonuclease-1-like 5' DNA nuclease
MEYTLFYFLREIKRMPWIEADLRTSIVDIFHENGISLVTPFLSKSASLQIETAKVNTKNILNPSSNLKRDNFPLNNIKNIKGIGLVYSDKLNSIYIYTVWDLLETGKSREGRNDIAEKTGISSKHILKWVNMADLLRVEGVGTEYSELLESAGVDTVVELSRRVPSNLHRRLMLENEEKNLVKNTPTIEMVEKWVQVANNLPRKVTY